jgi:membrane associated rhomboid family serine protease
MSKSDKPHARLAERCCGAAPVASLLFLMMVGFVMSRLNPELVHDLACSRESLLSMRLYTLITYALWPTGIEHLFYVSISLILSVYFIGDLLTRQQIWLLTAGSAVLGGVLFSLTFSVQLVGGHNVAWGLVGTVMALGLREWRQLDALRRAYFLAMGLFTLFVLSSFSAIAVQQLLVAAVAAVGVYFWHGTNPASNQGG